MVVDLDYTIPKFPIQILKIKIIVPMHLLVGEV
jgi:hypothetical protein